EKRGKVLNPVPEYLVDTEDSVELRKDETPAKYAAMFERRAKKGQCFNQPYLGCREFSCQFRLVDPVTEPATPIEETRDLGWMLYDMDYSEPNNIKPQFFRAEIKDGMLDLLKAEVRS
ncbi:MAG: type I-C CRISPR-associated protein Cas5c, partial [Minisyncoccota bacterium]